jgi:Fe2+ transport system protein FeoA
MTVTPSAVQSASALPSGPAEGRRHRFWRTLSSLGPALLVSVGHMDPGNWATDIGEPRYDPHGSPIPTAEGEIEDLGGSPLDVVDAGRRSRITRVDGTEPARLRYLEALGLVPGAEVLVTSRAPYGGPIGLRLGGPAGADLAIGPEVAATIRVTPLP